MLLGLRKLPLKLVGVIQPKLNVHALLCLQQLDGAGCLFRLLLQRPHL